MGKHFPLAIFASLPLLAATLTLTKPDEVGLSSERLKRVHAVIQTHLDARDFAGAVTLVSRKGKVVQLEAHGALDFESGKPLRTDTLFQLASMTKPMTAVAVLMMMEEGKLDLSDPISKYIPEFANPRVAQWNLPNDSRGPGLRLVPANREVTLQDLLTHTAGLTVSTAGPAGQYFSKALAGGESISLAEYCKRAAGIPLNFQPGTQWEYTGGVGFAVLGRVVEIVSGMNLDQFFRSRIFEPLAMNNSFFDVPSARIGDVAPVYVLTAGKPAKQDPVPPRPRGAEFYSGAGGVTSSIEDYFHFCQMLLDGGQWNGTRLLSRKSVELMTDNAIGDLDLANYPEPGQNLRGYGFGLGVRVRKSNGASGWLGSVGDYGWAGAYGPYFWVDPKEHLIGIIMMATRVGRLRTEFPNAVYQALTDER